MTLYVESSFVIEVALGQEESEPAEQLLAMADSEIIELALPAFSLSEPFATVTQRQRNRGKLGRQFNDHLQQLARSSPHQEDVSALQPIIPDILGRIDEREDERLTSTVERLLGVATIIETDLPTFQDARTYRGRYGLMAQDAIVFAAVVRHLRENTAKGPHFFANRNKSDFTGPDMDQELGAHNCTLLYSFSEAVDRLKVQNAALEGTS